MHFVICQFLSPCILNQDGHKVKRKGEADCETNFPGAVCRSQERGVHGSQVTEIEMSQAARGVLPYKNEGGTRRFF